MNGDVSDLFVYKNDDKYFYQSRKKDTKRKFEEINITPENIIQLNEMGHIELYVCSIRELYYEKSKYYTPDEEKEIKRIIKDKKKERCTYLCRNNIIISNFEKCIGVGQRVAQNKNPEAFWRVRIKYNTNNIVDNGLDKIFSVNMNKGIIKYDTLPIELRETIETLSKKMYGIISKRMLADYNNMSKSDNIESTVDKKQKEPLDKNNIESTVDKKQKEPLDKNNIESTVDKKLINIKKLNVHKLINQIQSIEKKLYNIDNKKYKNFVNGLIDHIAKFNN
jgi:hypothetical protein